MRHVKPECARASEAEPGNLRACTLRAVHASPNSASCSESSTNPESKLSLLLLYSLLVLCSRSFLQTHAMPCRYFKFICKTVSGLLTLQTTLCILTVQPQHPIHTPFFVTRPGLQISGNTSWHECVLQSASS